MPLDPKQTPADILKAHDALVKVLEDEQARIDRAHAQALAQQMVSDYGRGLHGKDADGLTLDGAVAQMRQQRAMANQAQVDPVTYQNHMRAQQAQQQAYYQARGIAAAGGIGGNVLGGGILGGGINKAQQAQQAQAKWIPEQVNLFIPEAVLKADKKVRDLEIAAVLFEAIGERKRFELAQVSLVITQPHGGRQKDLQPVTDMVMGVLRKKFMRGLNSLNIIGQRSDGKQGVAVHIVERGDPRSRYAESHLAGMSKEVPF